MPPYATARRHILVERDKILAKKKAEELGIPLEELGPPPESAECKSCKEAMLHMQVHPRRPARRPVLSCDANISAPCRTLDTHQAECCHSICVAIASPVIVVQREFDLDEIRSNYKEVELYLKARPTTLPHSTAPSRVADISRPGPARRVRRKCVTIWRAGLRKTRWRGAGGPWPSNARIL
jgi:hypothetical protein